MVYDDSTGTGTVGVCTHLLVVCLFGMICVTMCTTCSLYTPKCPEKQEVPGQPQKAALLLRVHCFSECFVTCQVNSEINSLLFCLSPAGAAHVSLPEE